MGAVATALIAGCTADAPGPRAGPTPEPPAAPDPQRSPDDDRPPNVLLVVTDDQRADTVDAMAAVRRWFVRGGTTFDRAHATTPVCCPSRASIMTGRYAHNHGVRTNADARLLDHAGTLQWALREDGYRTAIVGKYLNHWPVRREPPGFDDWAVFTPTPNVEGYRGEPFNVDGRVRRVGRYSTDFIAERSVSLLRRFEEADDTPWFLYVAPFAPHEPAVPAPRHAGAAVPDRPAASGYGEVVRARQLRSLLAVDELVERVAGELRALGEARDTLAFFLSDNGHLWGEHGLIDKGWAYTPSTAVPLVVRWPGRVPAGEVDHRLAGLIDVAPTVLEAAGIDAGARDGRSLLGEDRRRRLLLEHWAGRRGDVPSWASLLGTGWQYVERYRGGRTVSREYYDLRRDPGQERDLLGGVGGANDRPRARGLADPLAAARACHGTAGPDGCP